VIDEDLAALYGVRLSCEQRMQRQTTNDRVWLRPD
jgi:hypothetical protein